MLKIFYVTYQDFPSNKANSQQTITTCKYFERNGIDITLFFPLRTDKSNDNNIFLEKYYDFKKIKFNIHGLNHKLEFEKYKTFKKLYFQVSQFMWAKESIKYIFKNYQKPDYIFTRSDWILFLLSVKNFPVVFECHQLTKTRKLIMRYSSKKSKTRFIFMNEQLFKDSKLKITNNYLIQSNGYDADYFKANNNKKIKNKIVFAGRLTRNNEDRGIQFIANCFTDPRLKNYTLHIIGDSDDQNLKSLKKNSPENVIYTGYLKKTNTIKEIQESEIGLLLNSTKSTHSLMHTDPLKFYEYTFSGLNIVAPDFQSHKNLNTLNNITLYEHEDRESFIGAIIKSSSKSNNNLLNKRTMSVDNRVNNIISFLTKNARLEGLEPPTL